ncbi:MAG: LPS assembly lipoprotein LptE [Alphaproteobacteria bacterium]|nr:LPS assembly lipoprotein LptE [Alphaproteobacteria bacterium]
MWFCSRAILIVCVLSVAACGFRPLYKKDADDPGVRADFAQIKVLNVRPENRRNDRLGQKMHNILLDRLNPDGQPARPAYRLDVAIRVSKARTGIQITDEATRARLTITASFKLYSRTGNTPLFEGSERSENSYNVVESEFATLSAETDAADRAVREISDAIKLRLGIYFQRRRAEA